MSAIAAAVAAYDLRVAHGEPLSIGYVGPLAAFGVFSNTQIAAITGLSRYTVRQITGKSDHTGGNLPMGSLGLILDAFERRTPATVAAAVKAGASTRMVGKLAGFSQATVVRYVKEAA